MEDPQFNIFPCKRSYDKNQRDQFMESKVPIHWNDFADKSTLNDLAIIASITPYATIVKNDKNK